MCYDLRMDLWTTLRQLLPALAIVGLVLAPVARPVMAMPVDMNAVSDHAEMADHEAMVMPDGMPCCLQDQQKECAKDCPMMASCTASLHSTLPCNGFSAPVMHASMTVLCNDRILDSLSQVPPPRPPKA